MESLHGGRYLKFDKKLVVRTNDEATAVRRKVGERK